MINKPELKSRLRLFALPTGTDYRMVEALRDNPVADITDDGNRLLYQASPDEFFALYGNGTTIINAHAFDSVTLSALQFLSHIRSQISCWPVASPKQHFVSSVNRPITSA